MSLLPQTGYGSHLQECLDARVNQLLEDYDNSEALRLFTETNQKLVQNDGIGFDRFHVFPLDKVLKKLEEKFQRYTRMSEGCVQTVLFWTQKPCLTTTEVVLLLLVMQSYVFRGELIHDADFFTKVHVPHRDMDNPWPKLFWDWVDHCQRYMSGEKPCMEMAVVYTTCANTILGNLHELVFETHEYPEIKADTVMDVKVSEQVKANLYMGLLQPEDLTDDPLQLDRFRVLTKFFEGDYTNLMALLLQMQIICRVIQVHRATPDQLHEETRRERFADIKFHRLGFNVSPTNYAHEIFDYPRVMDIKGANFVDVTVSLNNESTRYELTLPLCVIIYLCEGNERNPQVQTLLRRKYIPPAIRKLFEPTEDLVAYRGDDIPRLWLTEILGLQ
jgi:hypothetical protein